VPPPEGQYKSSAGECVHSLKNGPEKKKPKAHHKAGAGYVVQCLDSGSSSSSSMSRLITAHHSKMHGYSPGWPCFVLLLAFPPPLIRCGILILLFGYQVVNCTQSKENTALGHRPSARPRYCYLVGGWVGNLSLARLVCRTLRSPGKRNTPPRNKPAGRRRRCPLSARKTVYTPRLRSLDR
jgi:hypothetical protein